MITVQVGAATVVLNHTDELSIRADDAFVKTSQTYDFDDVLDAVTRLSGACLSEGEAATVAGAITELRVELAEQRRVLRESG
jgi:hypothetical protein